MGKTKDIANMLETYLLATRKEREELGGNGQATSEEYWRLVTRHPTWPLPKVLSRLIKKIDGVDEEEIARDFERLVQCNKESVTSFNERFIEASNAYKIFYDLTEEKELVKFVTKLRVSNQKQLKLLRLDAECIEDVFDAVFTFETSQGFEQKRPNKFTK